MTTLEKNIEIAKMIEWKKGKHQVFKDYWIKNKAVRATNDDELSFDSDANLQFEVIDWIENLKIGKRGYAYMQIVKTNIWIYVYNNHTNLCPAFFNGVEHPKATRKEAIFEALFQFSQYLKQK